MIQNDLLPYHPPALDTDKAKPVLDAVCAHFKTTPEALRSHSCQLPERDARHVAFWLLFNHGAANYSAIGRYLNRTHVPALRSVGLVNFWIAKETHIYQDALAVEQALAA